MGYRQVGNYPTGLDNRYGLYAVYSREMADSLEVITANWSGYFFEDGIFRYEGERIRRGINALR